MNVPDEAVEAALKAWSGTPLGGDALMNALEAAAPHLMAQAWEEGEHAGYMNRSAEERHGLEPHTNPYRSQP